MQRYHKLPARSELDGRVTGNPDDPKEWEFPQNVFSVSRIWSKVGKYSRTLFTTSTRDDRVHPSHARKMVAKMLEMGHDVLLYENIEGGHGGKRCGQQSSPHSCRRWLDIRFCGSNYT